jgi:hypothetical protein
VLIRGGYTRLEQSLIDAGHADAVDRERQALQDILHGPLTGIVERELGRPVETVMSAANDDPDLQVEIFVLGH